MGVRRAPDGPCLLGWAGPKPERCKGHRARVAVTPRGQAPRSSLSPLLDSSRAQEPTLEAGDLSPAAGQAAATA